MHQDEGRKDTAYDCVQCILYLNSASQKVQNMNETKQREGLDLRML